MVSRCGGRFKLSDAIIPGKGIAKGSCKGMAEAYYRAVKIFGQSAYDRAQGR